MSRLDVYLTEKGVYSSRARARRAIDDGLVSVNGKVILKSSYDVSESDTVEAGEDPVPLVSRGGFKLSGAFDAYPVEVAGKICLDVGASTGGFTQVLLQKGAETVVAVDVGHNQLHPDLMANPKVVNMEGTDIRNLNISEYSEYFDFAGIDVSFISLTYILPYVASYLRKGALCVALIKPQFELGKSALNKKGIVKQDKLLPQAVDKVTTCASACGFKVIMTKESPVKGGDGNREFLTILECL